MAEKACLQVSPVLLNIYQLLPPIRSTQYMQLRDRRHSHTLPTCRFQLYKKFILLLADASLNILPYGFIILFCVKCSAHLFLFHFPLHCMHLS